jgi:hypothetical protein
MKSNPVFLTAGVVAALITPGVFAGAVVLYDNTTTDLGARLWTSTLEVGNQVILAGGTAANITQFQFQYYNLDSTGNELLDFRIYANTGPEYSPGDPASKEPGAVLFDSGTFSAPATARSLVTFDTDFGPGGLAVPNSFTWTVQFSQTSAGGDAGVDLYGPPTVGNAFNDIWVNTGTWQLDVSPIPHSNFAAQITGVPVPEPAQYGMVFGAIALLPLVWRSLRRKAN